MELKPGYKVTEVGVIPKDWETPKVGEVCGFIVPGRNKPKLFSGNIPWITTPDIENGRTVKVSRLGLCISRQEAKAVGSKVVPPSSVLFSCAGELGIVAFTQNEIVVNQQLHVFIPTDAIDAIFLLNALAFNKDRIIGYGTKTAVPYLNKTACNSITIPLPPPPEQRAISTVLSDTDALIESLDRLIAKKRDVKQATMQQLLTGKTRLPGFSGEWEVKRLGEVTEILMGQSPSSSNYNHHGTGLPLIQGNADIKHRKAIKRVFTTQVTKHGKSGDTLMSVRAPVGEISRTEFDVCLGRGVCAIRFDNDFMYHCLIYREPSWTRHSKGSTFDSVSLSDVKALEVKLPSDPEEQRAIATVLSDLDAEITALEARRDKTRALKQGMMQDLLTGKTRLVKPEVTHG